VRHRRQVATTKSLDEFILLSAQAMLRYALASGFRVPAWVVESVRSSSTTAGEPADAEFETLLRARAELVRIVAPATPRTILLVSEGRESRLSMLGPVRLVRQMLVAVLILLTAFVLLAMSPEVNMSSGNVLSSSGTEVLLNELFFLAAGGLGAAFSALFTAYRYISDGTYDPKYESSYWVRFILGLMAGLLLPALIPLGAEGGDRAFSRPLLALVGGFSAAVLYRILERLVSAVESLIQGDTRAARTADQEVSAARAEIAAERERLELAARLRGLQQEIGENGASRRLRDGIDELVQQLLTARADEPPAAARAPAPDDAGRSTVPGGA
jgi:hypothetical protein